MSVFTDVVAGISNKSRWYRLGETSSTFAESVSGTAAGTLHGTNCTRGIAGSVAGDSDKAFRLGASNADTYINFTRVSLTANQSRFARVLTTDPDNTSAYAGCPALTVFGDTSGSVWDAFGVHGGKAQFRRFNNSTWDTVTGAATVNDGQWHSIGVTYDSSTRAVRLYVDGVLDGTGTVAAHQAQGGVDIIGGGFTADYWRGDLDECLLFTGVLTDDEMSRLHFSSSWINYVRVG